MCNFFLSWSIVVCVNNLSQSKKSSIWETTATILLWIRSLRTDRKSREMLAKNHERSAVRPERSEIGTWFDFSRPSFSVLYVTSDCCFTVESTPCESIARQTTNRDLTSALLADTTITVLYEPRCSLMKWGSLTRYSVLYPNGRLYLRSAPQFHQHRRPWSVMLAPCAASERQLQSTSRHLSRWRRINQSRVGPFRQRVFFRINVSFWSRISVRDS